MTLVITKASPTPVMTCRVPGVGTTPPSPMPGVDGSPPVAALPRKRRGGRGRCIAGLRTTRLIAEQCLDLAVHLAEPDRWLIEAVLRGGVSCAATAQRLGVAQRTLQWRVKRLLGRLRSPEFAFIVNHRETWPQSRRRVAEIVHLQGGTREHAARQAGLTMHQVRRELTAIDVLMEQARAMGRLR